MKNMLLIIWQYLNIQSDYYNSDSFLGDIKLISYNGTKFKGYIAEMAINLKKTVNYAESRVTSLNAERIRRKKQD